MSNAIYTTSEFKFAEYFLNCRPIEPGVGGLGPIYVDPKPIYADQISIANIWTFLRYDVKGYNPDIVIYSHGMVTKSSKTTGLSLVLDQKKGKELTRHIVDLLINDEGRSAQERRKLLGLSELDMKTIDGFLTDIQVCSMTHLAFRACNIGNDPEYMLRIAKLFNAKFVSAPMQRDFFTKVDFYRVSNEHMDKLVETGSKLKTFEEKAAQIAAAKGKKKAKIVEQGLTFYGAGQHRAAIFVQAKSHSTFNTLGMATSPEAVELLYKDRFSFQRPVRFIVDDFFGDLSAEKGQPPEMKGRTMGLFGLSRGIGDVIKFPKDPAYSQLIRVVKNESYIGDLPLYIAPPPDESELIELNLRQRLKRRLQKIGSR